MSLPRNRPWSIRLWSITFFLGLMVFPVILNVTTIMVYSKTLDQDDKIGNSPGGEREGEDGNSDHYDGADDDDDYYDDDDDDDHVDNDDDDDDDEENGEGGECKAPNVMNGWVRIRHYTNPNLSEGFGSRFRYMYDAIQHAEASGLKIICDEGNFQTHSDDWNDHYLGNVGDQLFGCGRGLGKIYPPPDEGERVVEYQPGVLNWPCLGFHYPLAVPFLRDQYHLKFNESGREASLWREGVRYRAVVMVRRGDFTHRGLGRTIAPFESYASIIRALELHEKDAQVLLFSEIAGDDEELVAAFEGLPVELHVGVAETDTLKSQERFLRDVDHAATANVLLLDQSYMHLLVATFVNEGALVVVPKQLTCSAESGIENKFGITFERYKANRTIEETGVDTAWVEDIHWDKIPA